MGSQQNHLVKEANALSDLIYKIVEKYPVDKLSASFYSFGSASKVFWFKRESNFATKT
jgi:hypothetical protein